jgi:hypothetical protein
MALSNKFQRLAVLMEPDVQRLRERHAQRVAGHDGVRFDDRTNLVTYSRQGSVTVQMRAEKIGDWAADIALFRWWFVGIKFGEHAHRRLDVAFREGEQYGLPELTTEAIKIDSAADAETVAYLAAQLSRADGVLRATHGDRIVYFALFEVKPSDAPGRRESFSVAPPHAHEQPSLRPGAASRTMPPRALEVSSDDGFDIPPPPRAPAISQPPPNHPPVREPARGIFMPLAQTALGDVAASVPGFGQALLVVRVETSNGKGRFFVQLVALNGNGDLIALDPSRALLDAAGRMIADDARDGNGRWHKLAARLRPTERGASVDLDVA